MTFARDLIVDRIPRVQGTQEHLASWYTQGLSDGLGDRLLMFDNTNAPSWELLRFRPELAAAIGFEMALRERVERLHQFRHPSFTTVRSVEALGAGDGLALVATYAPGRRLSEAFARARSVDTVVPVIRQLTSALAALQEQGDDIAHGALTADRIMVTRDGRLTIREHVLGSALGRLGLSEARLWADLGVVVSPTSQLVPPLDGRTDVVQVALIALSLMLGRRIGPVDYPNRIDDFLDQIAGAAEPQSKHLFPPLRRWLERALQLNGPGFESARDAQEALSDLPEDRHRTDECLGLSSPATERGAATATAKLHVVANRSTKVPASDDVADDPIEQFAPENALVDAPGDGQDAVVGPRGLLRWVAAAAVLVAIGEALFIGRLLFSADTAIMVEFGRPGAEVLVNGRSAGVTPLELKVGSRTRSIRVLSHEASPPAVTTPEVLLAVEEPRAPRTNVDARAADNLRAAVRPQRSGGVKVSSPFEIHVLEGERLLGSSAEGPVVTTAGRHEFDLVNSTLGYRSRRVVDIKPGQIVSLAVTPPNGTVSINAVPWADVWIDGNSLGQTPLGNVSISLGEHEIVFRHPELGERREKALVRSDRLTRVSANFQR
jgi:PEGA domain